MPEAHTVPSLLADILGITPQHILPGMVEQNRVHRRGGHEQLHSRLTELGEMGGHDVPLRHVQPTAKLLP
jgi:hypothetical protein